MRMYDLVCALLLVGFLTSGLSCSKEQPAISPAQDCRMRCWVDGQGAGYRMDPDCVCVPRDE